MRSAGPSLPSLGLKHMFSLTLLKFLQTEEVYESRNHAGINYVSHNHIVLKRAHFNEHPGSARQMLLNCAGLIILDQI